MIIRNITLISTIHKENGKCNADELLKIIEAICPEVIFLEALQSSYTQYHNSLLSSFGIYHERLEINAIQKYSHNYSFEYIPVLDEGLSDAFDKKYEIVCEHIEHRKMLDKYNSLANEYGFQFLNSEGSVKFQEEMRMLERYILNNNELCQNADSYIDAYENSMIHNIFDYCKENIFNTAIFMCGVAHRKSIIEKIEKYKLQETIELNWRFYGN